MSRRRLLLLLGCYGALASALLVAMPEAGRDAPVAFATWRGEAMSTAIAVTLPAHDEGAEAAAAVFALFGRLEQDLSEWRPGSPLATVNERAGGAPVNVPPDLLALVDSSLALGESTGGAFDPTWAALWGLWDFRAAVPHLPDPGEIARRRALVGFRRVEIDRAAGTIRLPEPGMKVGLGAIAKGYALDRAGELLRERGFADFLVVAGGQVLAGGDRGGTPWQVGIRDPRGAATDWFAVLPLRDASASTSGDYESFFVVDGQRYHHVLDPRTGWPARGLRSATVVHPTATVADALSTALMVAGRERGLAIAGELGAEALVVDETGEVTATPGLASLPLRHAPLRNPG